MNKPVTKEELLASAKLQREQAARLSEQAKWADSGQARRQDEDSAKACIRRAEQMEKEAAAMPDSPASAAGFDLVAHLIRQREFSLRTFGPEQRTAGVINHIRKELVEIESNPSDPSEWLDVILLAFDGAMRAGYSPEDAAKGLSDRLARNESRTWPEWRDIPADQAIEHVRS